jgi:hypothetical protein
LFKPWFVQDVGIFLIAGRTKDPANAFTEGEDAARSGTTS